MRGEAGANTRARRAARRGETLARADNRPPLTGPTGRQTPPDCAATSRSSSLLSFRHHSRDIPKVVLRQMVILEQMDHERLPRAVEDAGHEIADHLPDDFVLRPRRPIDVRPIVLS